MALAERDLSDRRRCVADHAPEFLIDELTNSAITERIPPDTRWSLGLVNRQRPVCGQGTPQDGHHRLYIFFTQDL